MKSYTTAKQTIHEIADAVAPVMTADLSEKEAQVRAIIDAVRERGDDAVLEYIAKFDGAKLTAKTLKVTEAEFVAARPRVGQLFMKAVKVAADNIRRFHEKQRPSDWFDLSRVGNILGEKFTPVAKVGIHIPGATAPLLSSVMMTVIPAQVAGVKEIHLATPPNSKGEINPAILAVADFLGIRSIFKMAGAQAIAALAYGTKSVPKVDKVCGPGNIYTTLAKKAVFGAVGVDGLYGPSEVVVIADEGSNPVTVAADLIAQSEHQVDSSAILISPSRLLLARVKEEVEKQIKLLPKKNIAWQCWLNHGALVQVKDEKEAIDLANLIAPEHLELHLKNAMSVLGDIKNAGCIIFGRYSPAAVTDYIAGPSHCLPTGRSATFSSGLGVLDFMKRSSIVGIAPTSLAEYAEHIRQFTAMEGLEGHYKAVQLRVRGMAAKKLKKQ